MEIVIEKNAYGGKGELKLEKILTSAEMKDKCSMFARVTIRPGDSLGYHEHHGNGECYFVLSGEGIYDDNGVKRVVKAGETTWTPDGNGHGFDNTSGTEDLVFMALIINS